MEWDRFLSKIAAGQELTDSVKLGLFEGSMDPTSQKELQLLQIKKRGEASYVEFFASMKAKFGRDKILGARRLCQEIQLPSSERIDGDVWGEFEKKFRMAWMRVTDANEEEASRVLMSRLPFFFPTGW